MNKIINLAWNGIPDFHKSGKQIYISKPRNSINFLSFHELWKFIVVWFETGIFWSSLRQFEKERQSKHFFFLLFWYKTRGFIYLIFIILVLRSLDYLYPLKQPPFHVPFRDGSFSALKSVMAPFFSQGDNRPKSSLICDCLNVFLTLLGNPENRRWGSFGYIGLLTLLGCSVHTAIKLLSNWFNNYHHAPPPHDSSINCSENQKCFNEQFQYYLE